MQIEKLRAVNFNLQIWILIWQVNTFKSTSSRVLQQLYHLTISAWDHKSISSVHVESGHTERGKWRASTHLFSAVYPVFCAVQVCFPWSPTHRPMCYCTPRSPRSLPDPSHAATDHRETGQSVYSNALVNNLVDQNRVGNKHGLGVKMPHDFKILGQTCPRTITLTQLWLLGLNSSKTNCMHDVNTLISFTDHNVSFSFCKSI